MSSVYVRVCCYGSGDVRDLHSLPTLRCSDLAEVLGLERIEVFEVATFYDMFYTRPVGKFPVRVCTNVSCLLRGADGLMESLCQRLGVEEGETTADGRFTVFAAECLGACGGAPMMSVGDDYHEDLKADELDKILERYR